MTAYVSSTLSTIFGFAVLNVALFLVIAIRFLFDYDSMKARALDAHKSLRDEINKQAKTISLASGQKDMVVYPVSDEFIAFVKSAQEREAWLSKQISKLAKEMKGLTLFTRVNTGTGKWLQIAQQAEGLKEALEHYSKANQIYGQLASFEQSNIEGRFE